MKRYNELKKKAFQVLSSRLPEKLFYHDLKHTLDVMSVCDQYIDREEINFHQAELLRIAALLHDIGFTVTYKNHEEKGTEIAEEMMSKSGFSQQEIKIVQGLIMATKIPQNPKNKLEQIICDADLDYLGRNDFEVISERLFNELKCLSLIQDKDTWNKIQVKFLEAHSYHTEFAKKNRQPKKYKRLLLLKDLTAIKN